MKTQSHYAPVLDPNFKADFQVTSNFDDSPPSSLQSLVLDSELIVIGTVLGVICHRHLPENNQESLFQCTIYDYEVSRILKGKCKSRIKLFQNGGPLAWKEGSKNGVGYK